MTIRRVDYKGETYGPVFESDNVNGRIATALGMMEYTVLSMIASNGEYIEVITPMDGRLEVSE
jgi:hypothetical protein